jgi:hypothetical protein
LLAHGDGQFADAIAGGRGLRAVRNRLEESGAEVRIMPEAMAENAEGTWSLVKALGNFPGGELVDEVSAHGLLLPLAWRLGGAEDVSGLAVS